MRLIDADALLEVLRNSHENHATNSRERSLLYRDICLVQEQAKYHPVIIPISELDKTIDVAAWCKTPNPNYSPFDNTSEVIYMCSKCAYSSGDRIAASWHYCPNCGATMLPANGEEVKIK